MKEKIIHQLKIEENKIKRIIKAIDSNKCTDDILAHISEAKKTLLTIRCMILQEYLLKVAKQNNFPKKEIIKYYKLTN